MTSSIEQALAAISAGEMVLVVDNADRENEGDLIMAAEHATAEKLAFMVRYGSGVICVALPGKRLDELHLSQMVAQNSDALRTAYTVTVDYRHGTTTGISAGDRAATLCALVDTQSVASDFNRPGHVFPLRAREGGVLVRPGHTEAAVDLTSLAGLKPGGVLVEVVNDDGTMARRPELEVFAQHHGIPLITIDNLIAWRRRNEKIVSLVSSCRLPTKHGLFTLFGYREIATGQDHLAIVMGNPRSVEAPLVRVHSECLTGEVFGSMRCDCAPQLEAAMTKIGVEGCGVVVYLRGHEGRGIGLMHKVRAYALQDEGLDTVQANLQLGFPPDSRDYSVGAQILRDIGVNKMRLMTNNPLKYQCITDFGLLISECVPLLTSVDHENEKYLQTKQRLFSHSLELEVDGVSTL